MSDAGEGEDLPSAVLAELVLLPQEQAAARLRQQGWWSVAVALSLAEWALQRAEVESGQAGRALALATLMAGDLGNPAHVSAMIAFADARRATHEGDLAAAEAALLQAQVGWRSVNAQVPYARTFLGLTQVLAMQGRYDDAGAASQAAIAALLPLADTDPSVRLLLSRGHRNRANLLVYQEQHVAARAAYQEAIVALEQFQHVLTAAGVPPGEQGELAAERGHLALNLAGAHTFLDAPAEAEASLTEAVALFDQAADVVNRGRARTNLGRLYLRLGEYAAALAQFDQATTDLIGGPYLDVAADDESGLAALRLAAELLLEHALAYLVLNLLPEAARTLERCEQLFRAQGQPYELAQSRYEQGLLWLQQGDWRQSQAALDEALTLFDQLGNTFWHNRTQTARARLALAHGAQPQAAALLDELLAAPEMTAPSGAVAWDVLGLVDVWLLRLQLWLDEGQVGEAQAAAQRVGALLNEVAPPQLRAEGPETLPALPHLTLRLWHQRGRIAAAQGDEILARRYFSVAIEVLDRQRATLPLEEVRTAYLGDKMAIYSDLVLSLLAAPLPSDDEVAEAFAVVERARSRALLERLLATVDAAAPDESPEISEQRATLRRQLHWLYNQLLGESGNRRLHGTLSREMAQHEAAIQQLEWRSAPLVAQAEPVRMAHLQAILAPDQQALVYYFAGAEVLAFVVGREQARVVRRITTVQAVDQAHAELRFQLGRVEMGSEYVARHAARLLRGVQDALQQLYTLLVAPIEEELRASRLLLVPYGALHLVPFHALWDSSRYWVERVEISYVPSASIAVHKRSSEAAPLQRFAGFAPYDGQIPQAQAEIALAATHFPDAQRFHDQQATIANLRQAAASSDVLHLATHGLFRPDNSFFSALKLADGWIDVRELYRLALSARLVVLSACESGAGEVRPGDDVVGLARGFLAAGAQNLVASLWNVHDRSAAEFMGKFYELLQAGDDRQALNCPTRGGEAESTPAAPARPAWALRMAQMEAIQSGRHPYFWASFFAVG